MGRILRWIARAVETVLGAVFDFVKATVKRIQEGAGLFFAGIEAFAHYLLGRPFVYLGRATDGLRPVLLTHYRIDFDVLTLIDPTVTSDDLTAHRDRLRRGQEGIAYVMEVVTSIVGLVGQLQPPLSWLRLGVVIARWVRDRLERSGRQEAVA